MSYISLPFNSDTYWFLVSHWYPFTLLRVADAIIYRYLVLQKIMVTFPRTFPL